MTLFFSTVFLLGLLLKPGDEARLSPLANIPVNLAIFGFLWVSSKPNSPSPSVG
jgi:hypothetical protein